jgi:hypothetical protein
MQKNTSFSKEMQFAVKNERRQMLDDQIILPQDKKISIKNR